MDNLAYIESYFKGQPSSAETTQFERRLGQDAAFAEEVAFYLGVMHVARNQAMEEKKQRFREQYRRMPQQQEEAGPKPVRKIWMYAAAAAVISALIVGWFFFVKEPDHQQLAEQYMEQNFSTLGVNLGSRNDTLQSALRLYNAGKFPEALRELEAMLRKGPADFTAIKYAGIICLKLGAYDRALDYFRQLDAVTGLYANPGRFYQAVTLMKRNGPGDITHARQLLQQVADAGLEGSDVARDWLKDF